MNTSLFDQKVKILSRLIKESSLTLEESLILLGEESVEVADTQVVNSYTIEAGDHVTCTNIDDCSTWNATLSYVRYDETPTF